MPSILLQLLKNRKGVVGIDLPCGTLGPGWARDIGAGRLSGVLLTRAPALRTFRIGAIALAAGLFAAAATATAGGAFTAGLAPSLATLACRVAPIRATLVPAARAHRRRSPAPRPSAPAAWSAISRLEAEDVEGLEFDRIRPGCALCRSRCTGLGRCLVCLVCRREGCVRRLAVLSVTACPCGVDRACLLGGHSLPAAFQPAGIRPRHFRRRHLGRCRSGGGGCPFLLPVARSHDFLKHRIGRWHACFSAPRWRCELAPIAEAVTGRPCTLDYGLPHRL